MDCLILSFNGLWNFFFNHTHAIDEDTEASRGQGICFEEHNHKWQDQNLDLGQSDCKQMLLAPFSELLGD